MHKHDLPVWVQGDWMIGEYRNCDMPLGVTRLFSGRLRRTDLAWPHFQRVSPTEICGPRWAPPTVDKPKRIGLRSIDTSESCRSAFMEGFSGRKAIGQGGSCLAL